jgi:hypothetical protein
MQESYRVGKAAVAGRERPFSQSGNEVSVMKIGCVSGRSENMTRAIRQAILLGTILPMASVASARDSGFVQLTYGSINVSNGYANRDFIGLNSRFELSSGTALLLDVTRQDREEKVTSVAVGTEFWLDRASCDL